MPPAFSRRKVESPPIVSFKWSKPVVDEGFTPFPKRLLRCLTKLFGDIRDLQVVLAIVDYSRPNLSRPPSYDYLAFNAGLPVPTFKERVEEMKKRGWLLTEGPDEAVNIRLDGLLAEIEKQTNDESRGVDFVGVNDLF